MLVLIGLHKTPIDKGHIGLIKLHGTIRTTYDFDKIDHFIKEKGSFYWGWVRYGVRQIAMMALSFRAIPREIF